MSRRLLLPAFVVIALLFALVELGTLVQVSRVRQQTQALVADMLDGVELVSRIGRDVERERRLLDEHILDEDPVAMRRLDVEIAAVRRDRAEAARGYAALPQPQVEAELFHRLQGQLAALGDPLEAALAASRQHHDGDALVAQQALDGQFAAIDELVGTLINVNRADATTLLERVRHLQQTSLISLGGLALAGIILSLTLGVFVTRVMQRHEQQLDRQAQLLEAQNRELDAFAGRVAHDLRGPLTTIGLALHAQKSGARNDALLQRGVDRMRAMIEDLLAFSRADRQQDSVCDPAEAAQQLMEEVAPRLEHDGARVVMEVEPARVRCAEGLLRQVLWNLVDNAVKYHREGIRPEVEIRGEATDDAYQLRVRDNGLGMTPDELGHVFEPLYRSRRVAKTAGTGLGLSIVKRVLEAAGGVVAVESQLGEGTTFVMKLRRA